MIINDLHQAILTKINSGIKGLATVAAYPHIKQKIAAPAVLLELDELEPGEDRGTDQTFLIAHFVAWPLLTFTDSNARVRVIELAAEVSHLARGNRWGVAGVGGAVLKTAIPDEFNPEWDGYYTWKVEWHQEITIGKNVWQDNGKPPKEVWVGWAPETGKAHQADYTELKKA